MLQLQSFVTLPLCKRQVCRCHHSNYQESNQGTVAIGGNAGGLRRPVTSPFVSRLASSEHGREDLRSHPSEIRRKKQQKRAKLTRFCAISGCLSESVANANRERLFRARSSVTTQILCRNVASTYYVVTLMKDSVHQPEEHLR